MFILCINFYSIHLHDYVRVFTDIKEKAIKAIQGLPPDASIEDAV